MTRIAALDLGSNSFHLLVADALPGGRIKRVGTAKVTLRLAEPVERDGELGKDSRRRAAAAVADLVEQARDLGADRVVTVATEALRKAADGPKLVDQLAAAHGVRVRLLDGAQEGQLSLGGMAGALELTSGERILGLDLGGGSYEVVYGGPDGVVEAASLPLGVATLRARMATDPPRLVEVAALHDRASALLAPLAAAVAARQLAHQRPLRAVGTAGTIRDLGRLGLARAGDWSDEAAAPQKVRGLAVTRDQVERSWSLLCSLTTAERMELPGVSPKRADLLPAGGLVVLATMAAFDLEHLLLCDWGLREGVLLDVLGRADVVGDDDLTSL